MDREELLSATPEDDGAPKQQKSPLVSLEKDLEFYADTIKEVAIEVMVEGISAYPIFIAHQHEVNIGELILNREELNTDWTIQASTFEEFVEKGIIHLIPTTDNSIKYALCKNDCAPGRHYDNHVHFICGECEKTICLDDVNIPVVKLPGGFTPTRSEMVVTGTCGECK